MGISETVISIRIPTSERDEFRRITESQAIIGSTLIRRVIENYIRNPIKWRDLILESEQATSTK